MTFKLPDLPYAKDALLPHMSEQTLNFHHGKHHKGYIDKLNDAVKNTEYEDMALLDIARRAHEKGDTTVFNNAAQAWNHGFFWNCMSPDRAAEPTGPLAAKIRVPAASAHPVHFGRHGPFRIRLGVAGRGGGRRA